MPYAADLKDYHSDGVINKFDKWPLENDTTHDTDRDGTPDYLDTFVGDNSANFDSDELPNGLDATPYVASQATPPPQLSNEALNKMLLEEQMKRAIIRDTFGYQPDRDMDGTPDKLDSTPTPYDNDRDGDGDPDFYDPEPGNSRLQSSNDPYDPRNDEYWKDD